MAKKVVEKTVVTKPKPDQATLDAAMALFNSAPKIPVSAPKGKVAKVREIVELGTDLDELAAASVLADVLTDSAEVLKTAIKTKIREEYAKRMVQTGVKPETFLGAGPRSEAYCQLQKRSTRSPLDPDTCADLDAKGIPYGTEEKVPERFVINPEVLANPAHLQALAEAVANCEKLKGVDVVLKQEAEQTYVTNDDTLPAVARYAQSDGSIETATQLLNTVASISVGKYKIDGMKESSDLIKAALDIISGAKLLGLKVEAK